LLIEPKKREKKKACSATAWGRREGHDSGQGEAFVRGRQRKERKRGGLYGSNFEEENVCA